MVIHELKKRVFQIFVDGGIVLIQIGQIYESVILQLVRIAEIRDGGIVVKEVVWRRRVVLKTREWLTGV